jgi:hypothetical protein
MKTRTAVVVAVLAAAACTRDASGPAPRPTTPAPTNTHAAAPASPTTTPALPTVELKPGPHSPLADVDLPADVAFAGNSSVEERWNYSASYDDRNGNRRAARPDRAAGTVFAQGSGADRRGHLDARGFDVRRWGAQPSS